MTKLHWYQDRTLKNKNLWLAEDGKYNLSVFKRSRLQWCFMVWFHANPQAGDKLIAYKKRHDSLDIAMQLAEEFAEKDKAARNDGLS